MKRPIDQRGRQLLGVGDRESGEETDEEPDQLTSRNTHSYDGSDNENENDIDESDRDMGEIYDEDGDEDDDDAEEDEDESSGYDSAEEEKIKKELQEIPFEVLERLQETGHAVTSAAATGARATNKGKKRAAWDSSGADERDYKRANKNRPQEMSSKRPVPRFREVMQTTKREVRDPRFESLSGKFNSDAFRKRYKFIYDEELPKEAARLKTVLAREKSETKRAKLQAKLTRVQQQMKQEKDVRNKEAWEKEQKAKERKLVEAGKKPFFQRKSEKRKAEMVRKYQELKASGQLEKFMEKKRRKNAAKDHRLLPSKRR